MYVEELTGSDTINTMPAVTAETFEDRGHVSLTMEGQRRFEETRVTMQASASSIGRKQVTDNLQADGIERGSSEVAGEPLPGDQAEKDRGNGK
jgi:transaldolase